MVFQVNLAAKRLNARLEFSFVYPDKRGRNVMRVVWLSLLTYFSQSIGAVNELLKLSVQSACAYA